MAWVDLAWQGVAAQWQALAVLLPALVLAGYWFGMGASLALAPVVVWAIWPRRQISTLGPVLPDCGSFILALGDFLTMPRDQGDTACFVLRPDAADALAATLTPDDFACLMRRIAERLRIALLEDDLVCRLDERRFAVAIRPRPGLDTEEVIQIAVRLQSSCDLPFHIGGQKLSVTLSCGICTAQTAGSCSGAALLKRAEDEASATGRAAQNSIRIAKPRAHHDRRKSGAPLAPFALTFQPRINSNTGLVSGLIAKPAPLATADRLPMLPPEQISGHLLRQAAGALTIWQQDTAPDLPLVLRLPWRDLLACDEAGQILWQIDRFDLCPNRLILIVQEAALALPKMPRTLTTLQDAGCRIAVSLTTAAIPDAFEAMAGGCLHLPTDLVRGANKAAYDRGRAGALIARAEGLGLDVAAEDIPSVTDLSLFAQLGCTHLSGPAIARAMPAQDIPGWIAQHDQKLRAAPRITLPPKNGLRD